MVVSNWVESSWIQLVWACTELNRNWFDWFRYFNFIIICLFLFFMFFLLVMSQCLLSISQSLAAFTCHRFWGSGAPTLQSAFPHQIRPSCSRSRTFARCAPCLLWARAGVSQCPWITLWSFAKVAAPLPTWPKITRRLSRKPCLSSEVECRLIQTTVLRCLVHTFLFLTSGPDRWWLPEIWSLIWSLIS